MLQPALLSLAEQSNQHIRNTQIQHCCNPKSGKRLVGGRVDITGDASACNSRQIDDG